MKNKVAMVTGGASGMGRAIARQLLEEGARVAIIDTAEQPAELASVEIAYCRGDLTDEPFVNQAFAHCARKLGGLDYLVNAAGVLWFDRDRSALDIDLAVWDRVMAINLKSMVLTARAAVPLLRARGGGAMVHFSTTQCLRGDDRPQDAYQASKAGVIAFSRSLAIQLAPHIRSNVVLPGPTATPMQARWDAEPTARQRVADCVPLRRVGTPEDMANACLFLLSDRASYITGTELRVDGGLLARP